MWQSFINGLSGPDLDKWINRWSAIGQVVGAAFTGWAAWIAYLQVKEARKEAEQARQQADEQEARMRKEAEEALIPKLEVIAYMDEVDREQFENTRIRLLLTNDKPIPVYVKRFRLRQVTPSTQGMITAEDWEEASFLAVKRRVSESDQEDANVVPPMIVLTEAPERISYGDVCETTLPVNLLIEQTKRQGADAGFFYATFEPVLERTNNHPYAISLYIEREMLFHFDNAKSLGGLTSWTMYINENGAKQINQIRTMECRHAIWCESGDRYTPISIKDWLLPLTPQQNFLFKELKELTGGRWDDDLLVYLRAVAEGVPDAMTILGVGLLEGETLPQNTAEGEKWLRKAAESDSLAAMNNLGGYLLEGEILPQDIREGEYWLRRATEAGYLRAMNNLGCNLLEGKYLRQNREEGEHWLRRAAEADYPRSMYALAVYLIEGEFLPQNVKEGEYWLRKAVETGSLDAMHTLGIYLVEGKFIPQNLEEGAYWLQKVEEAGYGT